MTVFWIFTAILVLLAIGLVTLPLLKKTNQAQIEYRVEVSEQQANIDNFRDQLVDLEAQITRHSLSSEESESLKRELQKKLLDEIEHARQTSFYHHRKTPALALTLIIWIPLLTISLYLQLGARTELQITDAMRRGTADVLQMQTMLENWVQKKPGNDQALYLLGSHYLQTGQIERAVNTYQTLFKLSSSHPQVAAELAQVLFLQGTNTMTEEIRQLYQRALRGDEQNTTALGLKGIDAFEQEDYRRAIDAWQSALTHEIDPVARQSLGSGISKARSLLGETVARIRVQIDISPELKELPATTRIVLFARSAGSSLPPVVAIPLQLGNLPGEVILSTLETVDITARISLSGDVMTADYQAEAKAVKTTSDELVRLVFSPAG